MARHVAAAIVVMMLAIGCAPVPASPAIPATPTGVAEECFLPCWEGITPGVTSSEDALIKLHTAEYPVIVDRDWDRMTIQWSNWDKGYRGYLNVRDGVVAGIDIWFDQGKMSVEDLFSRVGEPESVQVELPESEGQTGCGLTLLYDSLGITASLYQLDDQNSIEALQSVATLYLRRAGYAVFSPESITVAWQGYGDYCSVLND